MKVTLFTIYIFAPIYLPDALLIYHTTFPLNGPKTETTTPRSTRITYQRFEP